MGKRIFAVFLALILCFQALSVCTFAAEDAGSPKHIPRIVSIVFDDSGSMFTDTDRWAYTSYAMQSFAAMMGSEDVLYITYLNAPAGTEKVDLSDGGKSSSVSGFANMMFGGKTPDKVQEGANCLLKEYAKYKTGAKYYLVVMSDGELDQKTGGQTVKLADRIATVTASTKTALSGADFETIYFSMSGDQANIAGATSHFASTSDEIVGALKNVSADIMGRTTVDHAVAGNALSFTLKYPALSIAIFAQKKNGDFKSFNATVQREGKTLSCQIGNYSIQCPTKINMNPDKQKHDPKIPTNPPAGVVSLVTDKGNPLPKGSYTVDLSGYDLQKNDIVVLVEPAVRIGCQYVLNNEDDTSTFEDLKSRVAEGDTVKVTCGLYEMNPDGSPGEPIPLDVLSPTYKMLINGKSVGSAVNGEKNTYSFRVEKDFANQELKIEAMLKGYQPFVLKETFGELNIHIDAIPGPEDQNGISLTKPLWKKWSAGQEGISFQLKKTDAAILERVAIKVEGCEGVPEGVCSALGNAVRVEGNNILYLPTAQLSFAQLPDTFSVSLVELESGKSLLTKSVKVIRPAYKFAIENPLADAALSLDLLKTNTAAIVFTLMVDYDGSGQYIPVSQSDCEAEVKLTPDTGVLPGALTEEAGKLSFVPKYDPAVDTQLSVGDLVGKTHSVSVSTEVDGQPVKSDAVTLSFSSAAYRLEVENEIAAPLTLDSVKTNQQKVIFRLLADYDGSGTFGEVAQWDIATLERLTISAGNLPGKTETVYDAGGKPIGKAFIPQYDENNSNGVPFTAVAGIVHEITATLTGTDQTATASVEVLAPNYDVFMYKEGIVIVDAELSKNTEYVAFTVQRDGRTLNRQELESLTTHQLGFDKEQPWIKIATEVKEAEDGTVYLACTPTYGGWTFPCHWDLLCPLFVSHGDMNMIMTLGDSVATAAVKVNLSQLAVIILLIIAAIILLILWLFFCACTTTRFVRGTFYKVVFSQNENRKYVICAVTRINPSKAKLKTRLKRLLNPKRFLGLFIPFKQQKYSITVETKTATFVAKKPITKRLFYRTYPESVARANRGLFVGSIMQAQCAAVMFDDRTAEFRPDRMEGEKHPEENEAMHDGRFITENGKTIVLFLTRREQHDLRIFQRK